MSIKIKKYSGGFESFSEDKLRRSLMRAGADETLANNILVRVKKKLFNGITTKKIYKYAMRDLRRSSFVAATKYDLKFALMRLGPAGYAFEKYVAQVLAHHGYTVETNLILKGKCVEHEIDVAAKKGDEYILIECKHHEKPWIQCRIQTALYVRARFEDLQKIFTKVMLVTNTKFSRQAIDYGRCMGLELLGWRYPVEMSLERLIDEKHLWPVSILANLDKKIITNCIEENLLLMRDLQHLDIGEIKRRLKISGNKAKKIQQEVGEVLGTAKK